MALHYLVPKSKVEAIKEKTTIGTITEIHGAKIWENEIGLRNPVHSDSVIIEWARPSPKEDMKKFGTEKTRERVKEKGAILRFITEECEGIPVFDWHPKKRGVW